MALGLDLGGRFRELFGTLWAPKSSRKSRKQSTKMIEKDHAGNVGNTRNPPAVPKRTSRWQPADQQTADQQTSGQQTSRPQGIRDTSNVPSGHGGGYLFGETSFISLSI